MSKSYSELILIDKFSERYNYLKLEGAVGFDDPEVTRWLHQRFYHTAEWKAIRDKIIIRDCGFDLAHPDHPITGRVIIHHINPIKIEDIKSRSNKLFDPENLISVSHFMHNAIHYGDPNFIPVDDYVERTPGDTTLW